MAYYRAELLRTGTAHTHRTSSACGYPDFRKMMTASDLSTTVNFIDRRCAKFAELVAARALELLTLTHK